MRIAVNMLCHNELPYLKNVVRQLNFADEIYIVDDYSTDGSWEWLNDVKKQYGLNIYQRKFDWKPGEQRDFLLSHTPKDCWVISMDADEVPTFGFRFLIKDLLNSSNNPPDIERVYVYVWNLVEDLRHYHETLGVQSRIYWHSNKTKAHHISFPHDTLLGDFSPEAGTLKYEQGFVHLKLLDKEKVRVGRTDYVKYGIYQKDHIGDVFESKEFSELPSHIGFDVTTELIKYLDLEYMLEGASCGK